VFISKVVGKDTTFEPRMVMLGAGNYDYTAVVSGLNEGDRVALLSAALLQQARQQQLDRMRSGTGIPGMTTPGGGAGGARPGGAGGAGGGGGGGGRPPGA
jgi:HlyD family secretion protein